jgi:hypothetical protein
MAKRFTDTNKWNKPFIRGLDAPYKLLWFYILDDCDHAGIWQVDLDVAQIRTGQSISLETAIQKYKGHIQVFDNGQKWFLPDFIDFQYGELNPLNRVHQSILTILKKYNIKPLTSPLQGAKDKDKDKDMDKDKDKEGEKTEFQKTFDSFLEMRKKIKKPATERAIELIKIELKKLSKGDVNVAIEILNQSIRNCWQDVFQLKDKQVVQFQQKQDTLKNVNIDEIKY